MAATNQERKKLGDALYERYGKPLESEHWGEFVAISPDGRMVLGGDMTDVFEDAVKEFGKGVFVFKVGPKAVGKVR